MSAVIILVFFLACIFSALTIANSNNLSEAIVSGVKKLHAGVKWVGRTCQTLFETIISKGKKIRSWPRKFGKSCHALWELFKLPPEKPHENKAEEKSTAMTDECDPWQ